MKKNLVLLFAVIVAMLATAPINQAKANPLGDTINSGNIMCNGMNNGWAQVTAYGGTAPYTYSWAPSGGTNSIATGLSAGTYTVTITDAVHTVITATVTITQPNGINVTAFQTSTSCATGCATAIVSGGTPPYSYSWPNGGTIDSTCGLSAGTYTISVIDNKGCTGTGSVVITTSSTLYATSGMTQNTNCMTANGTATATASGGTPPYTYLWSPGGQTTATATGLVAGLYTCYVTDHTGCSVNTSVTVTSAVSSVTIAPYTYGDSNTGCNSSPNGWATAVPAGGTLPYTYLWTPGGQTTATATGLSGGGYTCVVHDNNGCSATTTTLIINASTSISLGIIRYDNTSCSLSPRGYCIANASGGTLPYTYLWSPGGETTGSISGLSAGTYTCVVQDNGGCSATSSSTVYNTSSTLFDTTVVNNNTSCSFFNNGSATAGVYGGNAPFTYFWSPGGQTTAAITGLSAGSYTCVVTDNTGCTATTTCIVGNSAFSATIAGHNASCRSTNGWATASPVGGTAPFTYLWSPGGQTTATITGLSAGTYTCVVKDYSGCSATANASISAGSMTVTFNTGIDTGICNGWAIAYPSGGYSPFTYLWSPGGQTTQGIFGLCAGVYCVTITDSTGCNVTMCDTVPGIGGCAGLTPNICYVTSDTNFVHNKVIWQKLGADSNAVDSVIIYRGVTTTLYARVGAVSVHNFTCFVDVTSNPNVTYYYYKLGFVDTCNTNPLSTYHESVLLQCTHGLGNNINLNWNFYVGATVNYYRILRDSDGTGHWQVLDSVPGGVNAYTDITAPTNPLLRYRLNMNWNVVCTPYLTIKRHGLMSDYDASGYSNVSNAFPAAIAVVSKLSSAVNVYPNPTNEILNLSISDMTGETDILLTDVLGRTVYTEHKTIGTDYKETINIGSVSSGVYFLTIENNGQKVVKKVSKL